MPDEAKTYQLIVRQVAAATDELDDLLPVLQGEFGLDVYTARQRLIGPGLVMFGKGSLEQTGKIAALLQQYGFACWQIVPSSPTILPSRLLSLEIHPQHICFESKDGPVRLERGSRVVGVLADISGALSDRYVKRILVQNAYRGSDALDPLNDNEMILDIFKGRPVFDFYLLDNQGQPQNAVRVLPGKFNPAGLDERATMSARGNLEAIMALVEEYAQPYQLRCDFGLSQLPKCRVERVHEGSLAFAENLNSLNHYGWLLTSLQGDGSPQTAAPAKAAALAAAGVAVAAATGSPALAAVLAAAGTAAAPPGLGEVTDAVHNALRDEETSRRTKAQKSVRKELPLPPDRPERQMSWRGILTTVGTFTGVVLLVLVLEGDSHLLRTVARYGTRAGAIPGLVACALLWAGWHYVCLKREIENTPTSKVRSIAVGMVEVHGRALRQYALVAPMTQSACIYYRLRKYRREDNGNWHMTSDIDSSHVAFQIDDGTGRVLVDPRGALVRARTRQTGFPGQSPLTFTASGSADEDEKWVEELIYEGTTLYVLGFARPLREERRSLRERSVEKLRDLKLDQQALHRYDADGDGQISEEEWQAARSDAEQAALVEQLAEGTGRKKQEDYIVISRPSQRGMPFVIAETASEAQLTRNYGLISLPLLVIGLMLAGFALFKLLAYLGV